MAILDFYEIGLDFCADEIENPHIECTKKLSAVDFSFPPKSRVAVLAGSRNIAGCLGVTKAVVEYLKERGCEPFIAPAMGSHGGATAMGREEILKSLGFTRENLCAPVVCGPRAVEIGRTSKGLAVYADKTAWDADFIIPVNRVKPHTAFRGPIESGPSKMLAVGLGHELSANLMHKTGLGEGILGALDFYLASGKVPFGVALLENAFKGVTGVEVVERQNWRAREEELLKRAFALTPSLPYHELDILIVEEMGKDVSGTGMDINVIGMGRRFPSVDATPRIGRVIALDLTDKSQGNATGVGYADIITQKLADKIDRDVTTLNCQTSGFHEAARIPQIAADEDAAVLLALNQLNLQDKDLAKLRAVKIKSTSQLTKIQVTRALL